MKTQLISIIKLGLMISPDQPRNSWAEQFQKSKNKISDDGQLISAINDFDEDDWRW